MKGTFARGEVPRNWKQYAIKDNMAYAVLSFQMEEDCDFMSRDEIVDTINSYVERCKKEANELFAQIGA